MKIELLRILVCPKCRGKLTLIVKGSKDDNEDIKDGRLRCRRCLGYYPIVNYIPRFIKNNSYAENFAYEWKRHVLTQLDSANQSKQSKDTFFVKTGFKPKELKDKLILDAGCGMGRFSEIAASQQGEVIAIDLTQAIDTAYANLKNTNCYFIQADIFHLPFAKNTFDLIFSIGVLHHTPDTKKAFFKLVPFLKKNGKIAIWVYGKNQYRPMEFFGNLWRKFTPLLPKPLLYMLSFLAVPLYFLYKIPYLGLLINIIVPFSTHPDWRWRILDTFDWYSPKYQWKHTYFELADWFKKKKIKVLKILPEEASLLGQKIYD